MAKHPLHGIVDPALFKHVSTDDDKTVLQHKAGHTLTIAHKMLAPKMQAQLKALSNVGKEAETASQADEADETSKHSYGKVIQKSRGGEVNPKLEQSKKVPPDQARVMQQPVPTPCYADGGTTRQGSPEPQTMSMQSSGTPPPVEKSDSQKRREVGQAAQSGTSIPSASTLVDRLKNAWAEGGKINIPAAYADGTGKVEPVQLSVDQLNALLSNKEEAGKVPTRRDVSRAQNPPVKEPDLADEAANAGQSAVDYLKAPEGTPFEFKQTAPTPPTSVPPASTGEAPAQPNEAPPQPQPAQDPLGGAQAMFDKGIREGEQGFTGEAAAKGALGQETSGIQQQQAQTLQDLQRSYQDQFQAINQERLAHYDDIRNAHIDPNKYWDNHSKMASAIGLILGGFNPTTRPNAAMDMLKYQMDQSMQAQAKNLDSEHNLLRATMEQFHNIHDATNMTHILMNDAAVHQLQAAADKAQGPIAKAQAQQATSKLLLENSQRAQQLAQSRMMFQMMGSRPQVGDELSHAKRQQMLQYLNPELAKTEAEHHVPGFGGVDGSAYANQPVPPNTRNQLIGYQNVMRNLDEALRFKQENPGAAFSVGDRARAETLMSNLSNQIRTAEDMGVFKESEAKMMNKMLGNNPAGFLASVRTDPKLREMLKLKTQEMNNLASSVGLKPMMSQQPQQQSQQPVIGRDGKKYVRQGNYMVPVP